MYYHSKARNKNEWIVLEAIPIYHCRCSTFIRRFWLQFLSFYFTLSQRPAQFLFRIWPIRTRFYWLKVIAIGRLVLQCNRNTKDILPQFGYSPLNSQSVVRIHFWSHKNLLHLSNIRNAGKIVPSHLRILWMKFYWRKVYLFIFRVFREMWKFCLKKIKCLLFDCEKILKSCGNFPNDSIIFSY